MTVCGKVFEYFASRNVLPASRNDIRIQAGNAGRQAVKCQIQRAARDAGWVICIAAKRRGLFMTDGLYPGIICILED
jgi:hypothetical protein